MLLKIFYEDGSHFQGGQGRFGMGLERQTERQGILYMNPSVLPSPPPLLLVRSANEQWQTIVVIILDFTFEQGLSGRTLGKMDLFHIASEPPVCYTHGEGLTMSLIERNVPRNIRFTLGSSPYALSNVIAEFGQTKVHITVSREEEVPPWMRGQGRGWIVGEYNMLPGATNSRTKRERGKISGRTQEIQRLLGRGFRGVLDLEKLGERTLIVDCDVLVADAGSRTASLSGGYVALYWAIEKLMEEGVLKESPLTAQLGAVSVGVNARGKIVADLDYEEDSHCEVDMNVVMTREGKFIEIQGAAEGCPFSREQLFAMIECAREALKKIYEAQDKVLK